jgi:hypothetical protein
MPSERASMDESIPAGELLAQYFEDVDWSTNYRIGTKRYAPYFLTNQEANELPWGEFAQNRHVLVASPIKGTGLEALVISKSVTWSDRDANIYVGSPSRDIRSLLDLTEDEFVLVFREQLRLISGLAGEIGEDVYSTHGFNPEDSSPDGHSIRPSGSNGEILGAKDYVELAIRVSPRFVRKYVISSPLAHFTDPLSNLYSP